HTSYGWEFDGDGDDGFVVGADDDVDADMSMDMDSFLSILNEDPLDASQQLSHKNLAKMGHPSPHVWYVTPGRTVTPRMFHSSSYMRSAKKGSSPLLTTAQKLSAPPLLRLRNYLIPAAVLAGIGAGLLFMHYNDENRAIRQGQFLLMLSPHSQH
ncbi:hypothetical protein Tco_1332949, partial [Tanacetum coccineum]